MTKYLSIFLLLILAGCVWVYFDKDAGYKHREQELIEKHKNAMDSSHNVAERWRLNALEYANAYRKEATHAMKAEEKYNYLREENSILKRRIIRYNNAGLDSLLSARYGR